MLSLYCWNKAQEAGLWLDAEVLRHKTEELRATKDVLWIDLDNPSKDEESLVFERFFPVHPLTLEDITKTRREPGVHPHFPKAEEFAAYLFVIVNPLAPQFLKQVQDATSEAALTTDHASTQLSAVLTRRLLITHHYQPVPGVGELRSFLARHEEHADRGPDYLFHLILDAMVDEYAPVLDGLEEILDDIETKVFEQPTQVLLVRLLQLKRAVTVLRKTLVHEREVLARLSRGEFSLIDAQEMVYYRNVYDHVVRFSELIESSRDMVSDLMQTHLSATSNRLNAIMKAFATISTLILPMGLIASIYGMNFANQPEYKWPWGYPLSLGLMLTIGLACYLLFRWKKWI